MGGRGNVLAQAVGYVQIFFGGAVLPWLMNSMAGILRGTGNMKLPSALFLNSALCQIVLGGTLGLGLGPIPQFGMRGVAAGSLTAYTISISVMAWYMFSGRARVTPKIARPATSVRDVLRYPEGRRGVLLLAAAIGADDFDLHPHAGGLRHRGAGRLRHRRAARIPADVAVVLVRHCLGADDRHGDRRRQRGPRAPDRLDRGIDVLHRGRRHRLPSSRSFPISGSISSPGTRACWSQAGSICRWRRPVTRFSAWPARCIFHRRARPR